jgi:hypothetical protein
VNDENGIVPLALRACSRLVDADGENHVFSDERASKRAIPVKTANQVSWATSSATVSERTKLRARRTRLW